MTSLATDLAILLKKAVSICRTLLKTIRKTALRNLREDRARNLRPNLRANRVPKARIPPPNGKVTTSTTAPPTAKALDKAPHLKF